MFILVTVFVSGWTANGWRYKSQIADREAQLLADYNKQRNQYLREYQAQAAVDQADAEALVSDLEQVRARRRALEQELLTAAVVKSHDEICKNGGNPFGPDFARLWNTATD